MSKKSFYGWLAGALVLAGVLAFVVLRMRAPGSGAGAYTEQLSCYGPPLGLHLPQNLPDLMKLGPLVKEDVREVEQWEGYTATRKLVHFPGLVLGLVTFSNDPNRYMVGFAEISDSRWKKLAAFHVGESLESARRKLGPSAANDPELLVSYGGESDEIRFENYRGKLTKITYTCYTG